MTQPAADRTPRIVLRPVVAGDAAAMSRFVQSLGRASRRNRIHGAIAACSQGLGRQLCTADGRRHVAWIACVQADDRAETIGGEERYFIDQQGSRCAELAIAVAD